MSLAFAITTAPRPTPTLTRSLASLRAAGWPTADVIVHAEADPGPLHDPWVRLTVNLSKLGVLRNWVAALSALVETTSASRLVVLQDDVTWAAGSAAAVTRQWPKLAPFWTWYVDRRVGRDLERRHGRSLRPGAYKSTLGYESNGALCYGFTRDLARTLLASTELAGYLQTHTQNIDHVVPACCLAFGFPLQVWVPGLLNHALGAGNSTIKVKKPNDTAYWQAVAAC